MTTDNRFRCPWCGTQPLYVAYHDSEWGVPVHDDRRLFEFLTLEAAQAGLSWWLVLRKRENYRQAFADFDPEAVARFGADDVARLLADAGIIRNRAKINAAIGNARAFLDIQAQHGSFAAWQWRYVDGTPRVQPRRTLADVPATSVESDAMAKDMKRLGFKFMGATVVYAHMQAAGLVNDHLLDCFRQAEVGAGC